MSDKNWFQGLLDNYKHDFEYKVEEIRLDITEKIYEIMKKEGIGINEMANRMDITPREVMEFYNGYSDLTLKTLVKFSLCLNRKLVFSLSNPD